MDKLKLLKKQLLASPFFKSPFYLKYNRLIIPAIVLIIALLIVSLVTIPQILKLFATFKTIDELNQKKVFYLRKITELENLNLPEARQELETALVALPVDRDIPGVTGELLIALSGSGMSLNAINFSATSPESEKVQEYSIKMEINGGQNNLKNFLERVKVSPRLIKLSSLDISKGSSDSLSASVGFVTLYQMLPQSIGSVDEEIPQLSQENKQVLSDIRAKVSALPKEVVRDASTSAIGKLNPFSK